MGTWPSRRWTIKFVLEEHMVSVLRRYIFSFLWLFPSLSPIHHRDGRSKSKAFVREQMSCFPTGDQNNKLPKVQGMWSGTTWCSRISLLHWTSKNTTSKTHGPGTQDLLSCKMIKWAQTSAHEGGTCDAINSPGLLPFSSPSLSQTCLECNNYKLDTDLSMAVALLDC
jgi:hypothetical protein